METEIDRLVVPEPTASSIVPSHFTNNLLFVPTKAQNTLTQNSLNLCSTVGVNG